LQGETVWAAGHTRPPGNAYLLAGLLSAFGGMRETAFHAVSARFSVITLWGCYFLARKFTDRPLVAGLCVAAAPPFLVNGNKLESDLPMLALLAAGAALLAHRRFGLAALALAAGCFFGYQAVFLLPIFAIWVWLEARRNVWAWSALAAGPVLLAAWQLYERAAAGTAPAETLAGYFTSYGLLALERKWRSIQALQAHLGLMVSPLLVSAALWRQGRAELAAGVAAGVLQATLLTDYGLAERALFAVTAGGGVAVLLWCARYAIGVLPKAQAIPALWSVCFFLAATAVFYAGSARYLLPLAPAVGIIIANWGLSRGWLAAGLALNFAMGLSLATVEYSQANTYRAIAKEVASLSQGRRVYSNAEWGLRYYLGKLAGSEPLLAQQTTPSGSLIVESALAAAIPYRVDGVRRRSLEEKIASSFPLRTIGPGSHAGYSSSEFGVLPFAIHPGAFDTVTVYEAGRAEPTLSYLKMDDPRADEHLLGGFYPSDGAEWRWMGPEGAALVVKPADATAFEVRFHIPDGDPVRHLEVLADGHLLGAEDYEATGGFTFRAPAAAAGRAGEPVRIVIRASPSYTPPGDGRDLSIVMIAFGFTTE
ncbi:MAG: hypothetical protein R2748_33170, partial [Bryobacterales bacterium]